MKVVLLLGLCVLAHAQQRKVGKFSEVYSWKQLTYNIDGNILTTDRATADGLEGGRFKRQRQRYDAVHFNNQQNEDRDGKIHFPTNNFEDSTRRPTRPNKVDDFPTNNFETSTTRASTLDERSDNFYIKYNNVPMGAERVGDRLFISVPRRRYGIPATLNYVDLRDMSRSPHLRPYPSLRASRSLTSVYRTRADTCGRLWAVDTGLLELPDTPQQVQQPAIVVFDLQTDRQILRYELKSSDVPANNTPTGLASITVDSNSCSDTFAYIPDLTTNGIVVFSLRARDSWRVTHNYLHFNPAHASLNIAGQRFQWSDGIFSIALAPGSGCRAAYFHPLISSQEFAVNTCTLNNRTASSDPQYWSRYAIVGDRGPNSQSTMHDMHPSGVVLFASIGADGVACWRTDTPMRPSTVQLLASDARAMSYPADLHITGEEVWVIANTLPRFGYSRLNPDDYNFFIYKANVQELIAGSVCAKDSSRRVNSDRDSNRDSNRDYNRDSNRDSSSNSGTDFDVINQNLDPLNFGSRSNVPPPAPSTSGFQSSSYNKYN